MEGTMQLETTANQDFDQKLTENKGRVARPSTNLQLSGDFQKNTTNQENYTPFTVERPTVKKYKDNLHMEGTMNLETTANQDFDQKMTENKGKIARPATNLQLSGDFQKNTTNQENYTALAVERPTVKKYKDNLQMEGTMNLETTANQDFDQKFTEKKGRVARPATNLQLGGDFQKNTTNQENYTALTVERPIIKKYKDNLHMEGTMNLETTANQDFDQKLTTNRGRLARPATNLHLSGDFQKKTTSQENYTALTVEQPIVKKYKDNLQIEGTMDIETTANQDFDQKHTEKRGRVAKPATNLQMSGEFQYNTTNQENYTALTVERPTVKKYKDNLHMEGTMNLETTANQDFHQKLIENRGKVARPATNLQLSGDFQKKTTNQENFTALTVERPTVKKYKDNLHMEGTMNLETTANQDFDQKVTEKTERVARPATNIQLSGDFQKRTTNQENYTALAVERPTVKKYKDNLHMEGTMNLETTANQDFDHKLPENKGKLARPATNLQLSGNFQNNTTNQESFTGLAVERPTVKKYKDNLHMEGTMLLETTANQDFDQKLTENKGRVARPATNLKMTGDFQKNTTNQENYTVLMVERPTVKKYNDNLYMEGAMQLETTANQDFNQKRTENKGRVARPATNLQLSGDFQKNTTNQENFTALTVERPTVKKYKDNLHMEGTMDLGTTANQDFDQKIIEKRGRVARPATNLQLSGDFQKNTTNQENYTALTVERPTAKKYKDNLYMEGTMTLETTANQDFDKKPTENRQRVARPATNLQLSGDFQKNTTNQESFTGVAVERPTVKKYKDNLHIEGTMQQETTANQEFNQKLTANRGRVARPATNLQLSGDFQKNTTNQENYTALTVERPTIKKYKDNLHMEGAMQLETTANQDFAEKRTGKRGPLVRPATNLQLTGDFQKNTTSQESFTGLAIKRPTVKKYKDNLHMEGKMQLETTVSRDFDQKLTENRARVPRPATNLQLSGDIEKNTTNQENYKFGHVEKPTIKKYSDNLYLDGPFHLETTATTDFEKKAFEKNKKAPPPESTIKVGEDFIIPETTNQQSYKSGEIQRPTVKKYQDNLQLNGELNFETTVQRDFKENEHVKTTKSKAKMTRHVDHLKNEGEMDFFKRNREEYQEYKPEKSSLNILADNLSIPSGVIQDGTLTQQDYKEIPLQRVERRKVIDSLGPEGKMDIFNKSAEDFTEYAFERVKARKHEDNLRLPMGEFQGKSTFQDDYLEKSIEKVPIKKAFDNLHSEGAFVVSQKNKEDYKEHVIERQRATRHKDNIYVGGEMANTTTTKSDFTEVQVQRPKLVRQNTFTKLEVETKEDKPTSERVKSEKSRSVTNNNAIRKPSDSTKIQNNARRAHGARREQFRDNLKQSGDINFTTTNLSNYNRKPISKGEKTRPRTQMKLYGQISSNTTNKDAYNEPKISKRELHTNRLNDTFTVSENPFIDFTTTSKDYNKKDLVKEKRARPRTQQRISQEKFDGKPTSKDFEGVNVERVRPAQNKDNLKLEGQTFHKMSAKNGYGSFNQLYPNKDKSYKQKLSNSQIRLESDAGNDNVIVVRPRVQNQMNAGGRAVTPPSYTRPSIPTKTAYKSNIANHGDMDMSTINRTAYVHQPQERLRKYRPRTSTKLQGNQEFSSEARTSYGNFNNKIEKRERPHRQSPAISQIFDSFAPPANLNSSYRSAFNSGTKFQPCPASLLHTNASQYNYIHDLNSHKYYVPAMA